MVLNIELFSIFIAPYIDANNLSQNWRGPAEVWSWRDFQENSKKLAKSKFKYPEQTHQGASGKVLWF